MFSSAGFGMCQRAKLRINGGASQAFEESRAFIRLGLEELGEFPLRKQG